MKGATQILAAIAAVALAGPEQELAKAAAKSKEWTSCKFTITETVEGAKAGSDPVEGTYEKGTGLHTKTGASGEQVRVEGKRASKRKDGTWRGRANPDTIEAPFVIVEDLEKNFRKLEIADEGDGKVYSGELTRAGTAYLMEGLERRVAGQADTKFTAKVTVNADGNVVKIEVTGTCTVKVNDVETPVKAVRAISFTDVNSATWDIPAEAQAALDSVQVP